MKLFDYQFTIDEKNPSVANYMSSVGIRIFIPHILLYVTMHQKKPLDFICYFKMQNYKLQHTNCSRTLHTASTE